MHTIDKLLSFISKEDFVQFAHDTNVDKHTKKLHGELLFKLLLYCLVTEKDNSLRGMQSALESSVFRALADISQDSKIVHSSISERLNIINPFALVGMSAKVQLLRRPLLVLLTNKRSGNHLTFLKTYRFIYDVGQ